MADAINSSLFVGRWKYVADAEGDEAFYDFLKASGLSQCPVGTPVIVELSVDGDVWTQHDTFEGVNDLQYSFVSGKSEEKDLEDGTQFASVIAISGNKWVAEKRKGDKVYTKEYEFTGDTMKATYAFAGKDLAFNAFATFQRQN